MRHVVVLMVDPEHPYTLEQLKVVDDESVEISMDDGNTCCIRVRFTPTVPHCNLASTIGLCIYEKLRRELPRVLKVQQYLFVTIPSWIFMLHQESTQLKKIVIFRLFLVKVILVNKQVNDKERVIAALENPPLRELVEECIKENFM